MEKSINQIKNPVDRIINRPDQMEERISGTEDKDEEILHSEAIKKNNKC
jgi:hypothetical protein